MLENEFIIVETMEKYGGSFVKQLAILFRYADRNNFDKLKMTFPEYWKQYEEMAKR